MREIGSNFCWWQQDYIVPETSLSDSPSKKYLSTGREAIAACLIDARRSQDIKKALIPEYTCTSVSGSFEALGIELAFYPVNRNLFTTTSALNELIRTEGADLLLIHPYFGFDTLIQDEELEDLVCILDATQSFYTGLDYPFADYIISSLRKWGPLADGALALKKAGDFAKLDILPEDAGHLELMKAAFRKKALYLEKGIGKKEGFLDLYNKARLRINSRLARYSMSSFSKHMFEIMDEEQLKRQRYNNYLKLSSSGLFESRIRKVFSDIPQGVVPLYFPVYLDKEERRAFQGHMASHDIYCPTIWSKPANRKSFSEEVLYIYDSTLSIPIDQRYDEEDMERVLQVVNLYLEK